MFNSGTGIPAGFAKDLKKFDDFLLSFLNYPDKTDAVVITTDHGNDSTTPSTYHSREYTPLLFYQKNKTGVNLGVKKTVAEFFNIPNSLKGTGFLIDK